ncbi:hypothetical protein KOR42_02680 [Thalassoglobus neptunius]|uniref:Uncharacterized protein n=1 Tax=Thalassoglobus neptunius TaxID=1938619 RepID=A0A5C5X449_9PLAN|nr:hypothetical protein [Thalassoglobus neptunius]TWT56912.1 hypothetical protein KOR42_02680 [Thalassoglobus neptunius]
MHYSANIAILADIESFFGVVFFLIAFVGWVVNLINQSQGKGGANPPNRRGQRPKAQVKRKTQNQIDQFLNQARNQRNDRKQGQTDDVEVVAEPGQTKRRPPKRRRSRREIWEEQTKQQQQKATPPPTKPLAQQPQSRQNTPSRRRTSQSDISERRAQSETKKPSRKQENLPHAVDQSVAEHLSVFSAGRSDSTGQIGLAATTRNARSQGNLIGNLLRSKDGIKNAILLNEILSPPAALRNRDSI